MKLRHSLVFALGLGVSLAAYADTPNAEGDAAEVQTEAAAMPSTDSVAAEAPAAPAVEDPVVAYLESARAAMEVAGGEETARQIYREAIAAFPTDKRPWLGLAQSYYELSDFGNAILAAQEVVVRDPEDDVAHGILAISGLRVSTMALGSMRESGELNDAARREAEIMARNLQVLFGKDNNASRSQAASREAAIAAAREAAAQRRVTPAPAERPRPQAERRAAPAPRAAAPRAAAPAPAPRAAAPAPAPAPSNPFGALR